MKNVIKLSLLLLLCSSHLTGCGDETEEPKTNPSTIELCAINQRVVFGTCMDCLAGEKNDRFDPTAGPDTQCQSVVCQEDHRVQSNTCVPCAEGFVRPMGDLASGADTQCESIKTEPGSLCATNEHVKDNVCVPCGVFDSNSPGDDPSGADTSCLKALCDPQQRAQNNECVACPSGTRNTQVVNARDTANSECSPILCGVNQRVQNNECVDCPENTRSALGAPANGPDTQCVQAACEENERVQDNACVACPSGTTNQAGDLTNVPDTQCEETRCGANQKVEVNECVDCAPGTTRPAGDVASGQNTQCEAALCGVNQRVQDNRCVTCGMGQTNLSGDDASGANTLCDATLCPSNFYVRSNQCVACPAGTSNLAGDNTAGPNTQCDVVQCRRNHRVQGNQCVACPAGTSNAPGDRASGPDTQCDATMCPSNFYVRSNQCVACSAGSTNQAGDSASGPNTQCDATSCLSDERVQANQCVPCEAGTTNVAGDLATGSNTLCDEVLCGVNQRVQSNQCVPCGTGTVNVAGDVASGPDTQCDASLCGANQRVQSNQCTPCLPGTDNLPGDDPSGADTQCDVVLCLEDERVQNNQCVPCAMTEKNSAGDDASGMDTLCDPRDPCFEAFGVTCAMFNQAYLKSSSSNTYTQFGSVVAVSGDTMAISGPGTISGGVVDVFVHDGTKWVQEASLTAPSSEKDDRFGRGLAIDGDTIVVGAPYTDNGNSLPFSNSTRDSGSAYVFKRTSGVWSTYGTKLSTSTLAADHKFGSSVALKNGILLVGAPGDSLGKGVVHIYTENSFGIWKRRGQFKPSSSSNATQFGRGLEFDGSRLVVTADKGAYIYYCSSGINTAQCSGYSSTPLLGSWRVNGVSIEGDTIALGTISNNSVTVFEKVGTPWVQRAVIKPSVVDANDYFGVSVLLNGNTLIVGAFGEDGGSQGVGGSPISNGASDSGAVYFFERVGTVWNQTVYMKAPNSDAGDAFGWALALWGNDSLIATSLAEDSRATGVGGDPLDNSGYRNGAAYMFKIK